MYLKLKFEQTKVYLLLLLLQPGDISETIRAATALAVPWVDLLLGNLSGAVPHYPAGVRGLVSRKRYLRGRVPMQT